jgi:hypothetical protein
MTHPLTDEIIHREFLPKFCYREDDMRAAADWQLEQCIAWLDDTDCDDPQETAQRLKEAMRPQQ